MSYFFHVISIFKGKLLILLAYFIAIKIPQIYLILGSLFVFVSWSILCRPKILVTDNKNTHKKKINNSIDHVLITQRRYEILSRKNTKKKKSSQKILSPKILVRKGKFLYESSPHKGVFFPKSIHLPMHSRTGCA